MDVKDVVPVHCFGPFTYYEYYITKMFMIPLLGFIFVLYSLYKPNENKNTLLIKMWLLILFTVYPSYCGTCGESFRCIDDGDEKSYLRAELEIDCGSADHKKFRILDILFVLAYPIGIPLYFLYLLWPHADAISKRPIESEMPAYLEHLTVLCNQYENRVWFWEIVECLRKWLTLSFAVLVFTDYPSSQILAGAIVCLVFNSLFLYYCPYIYETDDMLAYLAHSSLLFIFLIASYSRLSVLLSEAAPERANKEIFGMHELVDVAVLLIVLVIIVGIILIVWEIRRIINGENLKQIAYMVGERIRLVQHPKYSSHDGEVVTAERFYVTTKGVSYTIKLDNGVELEIADGDDMMPLAGVRSAVSSPGLIDDVEARQEIVYPEFAVDSDASANTKENPQAAGMDKNECIISA